MSTYGIQISEWAQHLRNMTIGTSIATFMLVPLNQTFAPIAEPPTIRKGIDVVTTIPDGNIDLSTLQYRTSQ
jgi:hypothetical protein